MVVVAVAVAVMAVAVMAAVVMVVVMAVVTVVAEDEEVEWECMEVATEVTGMVVTGTDMVAGMDTVDTTDMAVMDMAATDGVVVIMDGLVIMATMIRLTTTALLTIIQRPAALTTTPIHQLAQVMNIPLTHTMEPIIKMTTPLPQAL